MLQFEDICDEVDFTTARSSGPGGQNVNKVNSKVILKWNVAKSTLINVDQKELILSKLKRQLTKAGELVINAQASRSQHENKQAVVVKFNDLLRKIFTPRKKRTPTKPTKSSVRKRVKGKKILSEKKQWRQKPEH